jgi:hypothetical protein
MVWLLPEDPLADVLEEPEDGVALEGIVARGEVVERHPAGPHVQLLTGEFFRSARHLSSQQEKLTSAQCRCCRSGFNWSPTTRVGESENRRLPARCVGQSLFEIFKILRRFSVL